MLNSIELRQRIAEFCERHDWSTSSFGRRALNDPNFWRDLTDATSPRYPTERTVTKLVAFMEDTDGKQSRKVRRRNP